MRDTDPSNDPATEVEGASDDDFIALDEGPHDEALRVLLLILESIRDDHDDAGEGIVVWCPDARFGRAPFDALPPATRRDAALAPTGDPSAPATRSCSRRAGRRSRH